MLERFKSLVLLNLGKIWEIYGDLWEIYGDLWEIYGDLWEIYGDLWEIYMVIYGKYTSDLSEIPSGVIKHGKWKSTRFMGVSIGKSPN